MNIHHSAISSEPTFRDYWAAALAYQNSKRLQLWPAYPEKTIKDEIETGLHFSAFMPDGVLAGFFSLALCDAEIWEDKEKGDAIYIHRMCVNPACKGNRLAAWFLAWAYGLRGRLRAKVCAHGYVGRQSTADTALCRMRVSAGREPPNGFSSGFVASLSKCLSGLV
jgi:hypothetical protein